MLEREVLNGMITYTYENMVTQWMDALICKFERTYRHASS